MVRRISHDVASRRGTVGALKRHSPHDTKSIEAAQADLKVAVATDYIKRLVDDVPLLNPEQRDRLAVLLRGGDAV